MLTVLVVEDEEQVRVLAESFLEEEGHRTLSAGTAEEALALVRQDAPIGVLFTDLGLNGEADAGLHLARKATEIRPTLKVLYTTGHGVTDGMRALFVDGSAYLAKPYTVEHLKIALSNLAAAPPPAATR